MPTNSFTKTVTIKGNSQIKKFIEVVEVASKIANKIVVVSVKEINKEEIKGFFSNIGGK